MMKQPIFSLLEKTEHIYHIDDIEEVFRNIGILHTVKDNKRIEFYNIPVAFDIETSSFRVQSTEQKVGIMYIWTLSICGYIVQGRTWREFIKACDIISKWYKLSQYKRMIIYVHNLPYEFQFMHKHFEWIEVFALKKRQPVRALSTLGIEFRCSYKLSGYSLAKLSEQLTKYKVSKLVGDLDYSLLRTSKTPLTDKEIGYTINDVQVIIAYIQEYIERVEYIHRIPLTKTGVVRQYTRNYCFYGGGKRDNDIYKKYRKLMKELTLTPESYNQLKAAFAGGFTHANALYSKDIVYNVWSKDFTSSYPTVMVCEKFPMSTPMSINITSKEQFENCLNNFCCLFDVEIVNLRPKICFENYISKSHCRHLKGEVVNNGRIVSAESLTTTITELDYLIIKQMYSWDNIYVYNFKIFDKGYLPKNFVLSILDLYENKTLLKGVDGKEVEYLVSKENVNSLFGMTVTDILRDEIKYSSVDWTSETPDINEAIEKNNTSKKRFLYYPWGVWVTAYARYNLFTAILELEDDYVYCDTDSVKFINPEKHKDYFDNYNKFIVRKLDTAMKHHGINPERTRPKNNKGEIKQMGIWDDEGMYTRFKTLGAKRYMTEKDNVINITVSGLNKSKTVPYLKDKYGDKIFEAFDDTLYIPPEYTGKLTHTYIDEEQEGDVIDYMGVEAHYHELSSIHLEKADYSLSIDDLYIKYILGIKEEELCI